MTAAVILAEENPPGRLTVMCEVLGRPIFSALDSEDTRGQGQWRNDLDDVRWHRVIGMVYGRAYLCVSRDLSQAPGLGTPALGKLLTQRCGFGVFLTCMCSNNISRSSSWGTY